MNLETMNLTELKALQAAVDAAISDYERRKKAEATAALEEVAKEHGFSLAALLENAPRKGAKLRTKGDPKYRNPEDPEQTWTGKGRKPAWVVKHLENGGQLEALAISQ
jgi:DNA-binding protein H-NS